MVTGEKAEYRSATRSRKLIRQAFFELVQEKELKRITVTDIVIRADINRRTFYAHYQDVRALVEQIENETIEKIYEFLAEGRDENFVANPLSFLLKVVQCLETNLEFYRILINSNDAEPFITKLKEIFISYMEKDDEIPIIIKNAPEFAVASNFISGVVISILQVWFKGDMTQSLDELVMSVERLITTPLPDGSSIAESISKRFYPSLKSVRLHE